ncbi:hypothetical protein DFH08DRAFT_818296 [Mycena albidolilacea]|uniref:Uncharacterized protein n=1 Tax=Mycena albidolilacea TaxID=1033008 RepID=A0AAD6ZH52_9AGAR|nr:hypothetical protein DFH08DRAFT_818296 [Mycena albidolilacea]
MSAVLRTKQMILIGRCTMCALWRGYHGKINYLLVRWTRTGHSKNPGALAAKLGIVLHTKLAPQTLLSSALAKHARQDSMFYRRNSRQTRPTHSKKTGTDEEIDDYIETLSELCALFDAGITAAGDKSQDKVEIEACASLELCEASMKGLVQHAKLVDIASLAGSSVREHQGQRGNKHKCCLDEDGENCSQIANMSNKRCRKKETILKDIINQ